MKRAADYAREAIERTHGFMPWDLKDLYDKKQIDLIVDVREPHEYNEMHIPGSICVPRGILEGAADWGSRNTVPALASARDKKVILVCVGGERSAMAGVILAEMGYKDVHNLKMGLRGWNDSEFPLENANGPVDADIADAYFNRPATPEQMGPAAVR